jgi:hypothetical protein
LMNKVKSPTLKVLVDILNFDRLELTDFR